MASIMFEDKVCIAQAMGPLNTVLVPRFVTHLGYISRQELPIWIGLKKSENRLGDLDYITQDAWVNIRVVEL